MNNEIQIFNFAKNKIRVLAINDEPFWIAKDVCRVLNLPHVHNAVSKLDSDEKLNVKVLSSGQQRNMLAVNESGIYTLILRSNKPEAKEFKRWITHEVLPAIRKTGQYLSNTQNPQFAIEFMMSEIKEIKQQMSDFKLHRSIRFPLLESDLKPTCIVPECSFRTKLNQTIRRYANFYKLDKSGYQYLWNRFYRSFRDRYHIDIVSRWNNRHRYGYKLDIIDELNKMEEAYNLALKMFKTPERGVA